MGAKIKGSVWFTPMQSTQDAKCIGIVVTDNGFEERAYIGFGTGLSDVVDTKAIAELGAKFPLDLAKKLI